MSPSIATGERLRRTERVISFIRVGVVLFNVASYQSLSPSGLERDGLADLVCVIATIYAFATLLYRPEAESSLRTALASTFLDNVFIGVWLYATGGFASPYYPLFYAEAAASIGRFGIVYGNLAGAGGALIYLVVVSIDGFEGTGYRLPIRIAYIFLISAFVSYVVDVARRSEREVAEAEQQAAAFLELDRLRTLFVTNISHELRTPLTAIRGAAATLARRDVPEAEQRTLIEMIDRQSSRLSSLVQDIIDVGLMEQGKLMPSYSTVDLAAVVALEVQAARERSGRDVRFSRPSGGIAVACDGSKIGNALSKILDNAVKFSPQGTPVDVELSGDEAELRITVTDHGIGIAPQDVEGIFERFHQVDPSNTRAAGGAGIGLSIARTIVELHNGRIEVDSTPGGGSSFALVIPRSLSEPTLEELLRDSRSV